MLHFTPHPRATSHLLPRNRHRLDSQARDPAARRALLRPTPLPATPSAAAFASEQLGELMTECTKAVLSHQEAQGRLNVELHLETHDRLEVPSVYALG